MVRATRLTRRLRRPTRLLRRSTSRLVHRVRYRIDVHALHPLDAIGCGLLVNRHECTIATMLARPEIRGRRSVFLEDLDLGHVCLLSVSGRSAARSFDLSGGLYYYPHALETVRRSRATSNYIHCQTVLLPILISIRIVIQAVVAVLLQRCVSDCTRRTCIGSPASSDLPIFRCTKRHSNAATGVIT